jgi:hypothetical protein
MANSREPAWASMLRAPQKCPMTNSGLLLFSEAWCSIFTPGIFLPALPDTNPSTTYTGCPSNCTTGALRPSNSTQRAHNACTLKAEE